MTASPKEHPISNKVDHHHHGSYSSHSVDTNFQSFDFNFICDLLTVIGTVFTLVSTVKC